MKKYYLIFLSLFISTTLVSQSTVETHTFYSPALGVDKSYQIYLPDGYTTNSSDYYPSVYFLRLHGREWFDAQLRDNGMTLKNVLDDLIENEQIGKMIIITPSTGGNTYNNISIGFGMVNMLRPDYATDQGIGTGAFEDYFFQDLIPHIDSTYRTIHEWCARGIDGFSLGGYTSTLYAIKRPGVFSSVGSYDGTIMWYDLDDPGFSGPCDDRFWYGISTTNKVSSMFDLPFNKEYMKSNSATNIVAVANQITLDSIKKIAFHISTGDETLNMGRSQQLLFSLQALGIRNSFSRLEIAQNAIHTYDWADEHAKKSLVKHWETFTSLSCNSISTGTHQSVQPIQLFDVYPNPVSTSTTITFELSEQKSINFNIYDSNGKIVQKLLDDKFPSGKHQLQVNMAKLPNGLYLFQLESDAQIHTKKILVFK